MPHRIQRLAPGVGCGRCAVQSIARSVGRFSPQRRSCRQLRSRKKRSRAWIRPAVAAVSIKPSARSAIPLHWGLSAVVIFCLIGLGLHRSPNSPPRNSPPPSDRTIIALEGTPSARVSARNCSKNSVVSDLWRIKATSYVYREKSSRAMRVYRFLLRDDITLVPLKSTRTLPCFLSARVCVGCLMPLRRPFAMEHPLHSWKVPFGDDPLLPCGLSG